VKLVTVIKLCALSACRRGRRQQQKLRLIPLEKPRFAASVTPDPDNFSDMDKRAKATRLAASFAISATSFPRQ
jgi:hypothetical protein